MLKDPSQLRFLCGPFQYTIIPNNIVIYDKLTRTEYSSVSPEPSSSIHPYSGEASLELRTCKSPQSCLENPWFHLLLGEEGRARVCESIFNTTQLQQ